MSHLTKFGSVVAVISLCAIPATLLAQPATAPFPTGPGSLHGIWSNITFTDVRTGPPGDTGPPRKPVYNDANGQPIQMWPFVRKMVDERDSGWAKGIPYEDYATNCSPAGMPAATGTNAQAPIQFVESPDQKQITILNENQFSSYRVIKMDQEHSANPTPTIMGESVGHWEGDTLVVDTIAVSEETMVRGVMPHSQKLHIVERIRRTGPEALENKVTVDDPWIFAKPFAQQARFKKVAGMRMGEFICTNNRHLLAAEEP